jgi:hypothetical protein
MWIDEDGEEHLDAEERDAQEWANARCGMCGGIASWRAWTVDGLTVWADSEWCLEQQLGASVVVGEGT